MTFTILIVEKLGNIKPSVLKSQEECDLYKKAGFKSNSGFKCLNIWSVENNDKKYNIYLYGKTTGKANQENKYEFPPPIDKLLFFGNCLLINKDDNNNIVNLSIKEWESIYEILYGGFEDIEDCIDEIDDDDDDENDGVVDKQNLTKHGYLKDDFIVDDDYEEEPDDENDEIELSDEEKEVTNSKKKKGIVKPKKKSIKKLIEEPVVEEEGLFLDCCSELSEESYIE